MYWKETYREKISEIIVPEKENVPFTLHKGS
jgi:hypothetical protein